MLAVINTGEERTLLQGISWNLYENLLTEIGDNGKARLSYYRGDLEFMTPLPSHENYNRQIERAIVVFAEELDLDYNLFGSMTIKRPDLEVGKEPDSCYYFANELAVRGKTKLDFTQDPPPDLAVEIDITSSSLNQLTLYATLGVGEVWRYDGKTLIFYQLQSDKYEIVDRSPTFPILSPDRVLEFLTDCQIDGINQAVKNLRKWIQTNL
ncbi:Uma2 family endonuclease [Chamaesiphon sp. VAR_48_metabat_135_sub]|uniref:Uma2 family endonuclease n=1 Tax=Chamaesiphon sp. VAR_48_metabat_135_sub TaxID=2964699 RepID=UPI00286B5107|nr:Uma2 family endonuclease [Chamaesiphon sp. VAR_48_metabat_135_sub]